MTEMYKKVAVIGGGVIGGGWVARFLLCGQYVSVFDPHPQAKEIIETIVERAENAYSKLFVSSLPPKGRLHFAASLEEAVQESDYIQESIPEQLDLKRDLYAGIEKAARPDAIIASSTSGFRPSELCQGMVHPERFVVAHPFNPVYLIPLVEVVPAAACQSITLDTVLSFLTLIGMKPLHVKKEIDAHIADRLLEAVWREALWLVKDGIATTAEIDDAIRYGFGLRWAQMGLFETYRIAGGQQGMRHFLKQFGPALQWPWSKLTDVPDLTEELIDQIADQSDKQSGRYTIHELEDIRDDNLVSILKALKQRNWGAGKIVASVEEKLGQSSAKSLTLSGTDLSAPLMLHSADIREEWADYNGHMTEHRYLQIFGDATDAFLAHIGMDQDYLACGFSVFTVETHIRHLDEVKVGALVDIKTQLLGFDEKRVRLVHEMINRENETVVATSEHMLLHVNTELSSASPFGEPLKTRLSKLSLGQETLAMPSFAGASIRPVSRAN